MFAVPPRHDVPPHQALAHLRDAAAIAKVPADGIDLPTGRHVVVDGMRLHYLDWGSAERPALLFLHGGCLTAHTWDLVCLALRRDFRCVALDLRGHGDSEWSPGLDYQPEDHARDIHGLIEQAGLRRPVLIGQSLGGLIAMTYAQRAGGLAGIVLVDVGPDVRPAAVQQVKRFVMGDPVAPSIEDFVERARAFNPRRDPRLLRLSLLHNLRRLPDGSWTWKYDRRGLTDEYFADIKRRLDGLRDAAPAVSCPALVLRGAESDSLSAPAATAFAAAFPDGRCATVERAGHTVQGDNPAALARELRTFLGLIRH